MPAERAEAPAMPTPPAPSHTSREGAVIWAIWLTYGTFYFCRTNISAASPGMQALPEDGGLGLTSVQFGYIVAALKIAYGLGQALNGQLAERISPRVLLALGMFGSAALNVVFGLSAGFWFLLFVWACNGYCQSLGWTPSMRVVANWVPVARRGRAIGLIGTGYQVTQGLTFIVAAWSAELLGWRGAFYVPSMLLFAAGVFMLVCLEDAPAVAPTLSGDAPPPARSGSFFENVLLTIGNPRLWLLGLSLALLDAARYGYIDWGLKHLKDVQATSVGPAGLKYAVLPLGAIFGVFLSGWATDRFFGGRRAPVIVVLLLGLAGLTLVYDVAARVGGLAVLPLLVLIGFCMFGPQVLLVGTAPVDLARRGTSAAAAGFVNFMGYMGAAAGDVVTGHVVGRWGWQTALYVWAAWAVIAAAAAALLWNATAARDKRTE